MKDAPFLSIMSDGSTDSAVLEQEIVYTRFAISGQVFVKFLSLQAVEKGAATNIKSAIENAVEEYLPGWKEKLVAIVSDGASVMQGRKGGVIALLRQDCPWLQVQITTPYICDGDNIFLPILSQLQVQNTWSNTQYPN